MMKKSLNYFVNSVLAGAMIAFGGTVYLCCASLPNGSVVGSFLFSLGLLTVVARGYDLYTGKIGYLSFESPYQKTPPTNPRQAPLYFPIIILGNFVGTAAVALAFRCTRAFDALPTGILATTGEKLTRLQLMCQAKLNDTPLSIFLLACACGAMMFLAVDGYKKTKSWLFVILPVMVFILCGFEHCVANMFYFWAADCWDLHAFAYLALMILGNAVGALLFSKTARACF